MSSAYALKQRHFLWQHGRDHSRQLHDDSIDRRFVLKAQVKSGDLFITLATQLDELSRQLDGSEITEQLQNIVTDLLLLQSGYEVVQKDSTLK